jgi:thioredoxin reductase (NADPH)
MNTSRKLIIIGSGPAGLTAAIYSARANLQPLVIDGTEPGGQLMGTSIVENWPGEKQVMGPKLMMNMREHAKSFDTEFLEESIIKVDFSKKLFLLWTDRKKELTAQSIIIATGASPNRLNIPGEKEYWGKGISTCAVCDAFFFKDKRVIIIGGGDTAMESASFLRKFTKQITIIQILDKLSASFAMQQRIINDPDIKIVYNTTVTKFHGNQEKLTKVSLKNQKTGSIHDMEVDGAFLAIGLTPNTKVFKGHIDLDKHGYINVKDHTKTSIEGVFAAGDAADFRYRQAITSAGAGCMAALDAERYLASSL